MAHLIKPGEIKVVSKNNEILVNISLDLNISLDGTVTGINPQVQSSQSSLSNENKIKNSNDTVWEIPDFESTTGKLNFGKEEKDK